MIKEPLEEFRKRHRIQTLHIPTTDTWQASIYEGKRKRWSARGKTRFDSIRNLANRLELEGREELRFG